MSSILSISDNMSSSLHLSEDEEDSPFVDSCMIQCHDKDIKDFFNNFHLLDFIGHGTDGSVRKCKERKSGNIYAVKIINFGRFENMTDGDGTSIVQQLENEVQVLRDLKGQQYVAQIHRVFKGEFHLLILFEWYPKGDLFEIVHSSKYLSEKKSLKYFKQILLALYECHSRDIIHRDVKLENILIDENDNIRLADFGLARWLGQTEELFELCGTDTYFSPEAIYAKVICKHRSRGYNKKADVWAAGVLLYAMVYGKAPFFHHNRLTMFQSILRGEYSFLDTKSHTVSPQIKNLIQKLLTTDPVERITIKEALDHPVFTFNPKRTFRSVVWSIIFWKSFK
ncbi:phosphorylase b kinase gamma catalytic chain, liver/testis isoform-like [Lepeophtheirus salmonis]|uniref:phosphorylase b kinase gamma catalytic chain, liver/testis isoform-like n=1 Tax=Lepeophtheirus salmonis TaxID=72036 RepID=UPI001AE7B340|nr:phosphorylase b kinase gamma catalytic chain, liver/testis isoform-like [Lepeophtheirus salmonis]